MEKHLAALAEQVKQIAETQRSQGRQLADIADRLARMEERSIARDDTVARIDKTVTDHERRIVTLENANTVHATRWGSADRFMWKLVVPVMVALLTFAGTHYFTAHDPRAASIEARR